MKNLKGMRIGFCAMIAITIALFITMKQKQFPLFVKGLYGVTLMPANDLKEVLEHD